jgi:hypothetical protein
MGVGVPIRCSPSRGSTERPALQRKQSLVSGKRRADQLVKADFRAYVAQQTAAAVAPAGLPALRAVCRLRLEQALDPMLGRET